MFWLIFAFGVLLINLSGNHCSLVLEKHHKEQNNYGNIIIVKDITDYQAENPGVKLQELKPKKVAARSIQERAATQYTYVFSGGTRFESDKLLVRGYDTNDFTSGRTLKAVMQYPDPSTVINPNSSPIINYFEVSVYQSNNIGKAYIVEGGIGYRKITIVVEMVDTLFYGVIALIYGYN